MPVFKRQSVFIARDLKAFLNLEAGVTRPDAATPMSAANDRQPAEKQPPKKRLAEKDGSTAEAQKIQPGNVVWIFGFGRSGSTWLSSMMGDMKRQAVWPEPLIGSLFGRFYYTGVQETHRNSRWFILGSEREHWLKLIRSFFLDGATEKFPNMARSKGTLVVKEQNGSVGAPLLMEALPDSKMILLVRDPRDVVASALESLAKGSWGSKTLNIDNPPDVSVETWANHYLENVGNARQAYESHPGRKVLVRYEDLRADPLGTMRRLYSELGIDVDGDELARVVEKHSWENIPEEKKGQGKFYRKATPGGWQEDLSAEQIQATEEICGDLMQRFGYL